MFRISALVLRISGQRLAFGFVFHTVLCQTCLDACHSALDAESRTIEKSGFLLEFIPHSDAGQEWQTLIWVAEFGSELALFFQNRPLTAKPLRHRAYFSQPINQSTNSPIHGSLDILIANLVDPAAPRDGLFT